MPLAKKESGKKIHLRVITPVETKVDQAIDMVIMRCIDGDIGILPGHETHVCILSIGVLRVRNQGRESKLLVFGGVCEVAQDVVTILTEEAHWPEDLDRDRAEEARVHSMRLMQEKTDDREILQDQILLRRALVQIEAGSLPLESDTEEEPSVD